MCIRHFSRKLIIRTQYNLTQILIKLPLIFHHQILNPIINLIQKFRTLIKTDINPFNKHLLIGHQSIEMLSIQVLLIIFDNFWKSGEESFFFLRAVFVFFEEFGEIPEIFENLDFFLFGDLLLGVGLVGVWGVIEKKV